MDFFKASGFGVRFPESFVENLDSQRILDLATVVEKLNLLEVVPPKPPKSYVYGISSEALPFVVKIGYATDVERRMNTLQTGSPSTLRLIWRVEGASQIEKLMHNRMNEVRLQGEWFNFQTLTDSVDQIPNLLNQARFNYIE